MMQLAAGIRTTIQGLGLPAVVAALQAAQGNLTSAQPQLMAAANSMDGYVATYGAAGGMPPGGWSALATGVRAAGSAVGSAAAQLPSNLSAFNQAGFPTTAAHTDTPSGLHSSFLFPGLAFDLDSIASCTACNLPDCFPAYLSACLGACPPPCHQPPLLFLLQASALQAQLPVVHSVVASQAGKVSAMQGQLAAMMPDVGPYLASLAGMEAPYAALPTPHRQLALGAEAAIQGIVGSMQQVAGRYSGRVGRVLMRARLLVINPAAAAHSSCGNPATQEGCPTGSTPNLGPSFLCVAVNSTPVDDVKPYMEAVL